MEPTLIQPRDGTDIVLSRYETLFHPHEMELTILVSAILDSGSAKYAPASSDTRNGIDDVSERRFGFGVGQMLQLLQRFQSMAMSQLSRQPHPRTGLDRLEHGRPVGAG